MDPGQPDIQDKHILQRNDWIHESSDKHLLDSSMFEPNKNIRLSVFNRPDKFCWLLAYSVDQTRTTTYWATNKGL